MSHSVPKSERNMLLLLMVVASYMLIESFDFSSQIAMFPQISAIGVIVGSSTLLLRGKLPTSVREQMEVEAGDSESEKPTSENEHEDFHPYRSVFSYEIHHSLFAAASIGAYILSSFLFGIFWMSPLFVLIYTAWFRLSWYYIVPLVVLTVAICNIFMTVLYLPLDEGYLLSQFSVVIYDV